MKRVIISLAAALMTASLISSTLYADKYSEEKVKKLIKKVEQTLDKYTESDAEKYAGKELGIIEEYIKKSKMFLDNNDRDEAWYEIGKAKAFFKLIDAKKNLIIAEKEYNGLKK